MMIALILTSQPYISLIDWLGLSGWTVVECALCATFWTTTALVVVYLSQGIIAPYTAPIAIAGPTLIAEATKRWITR